MTETSVKHHFCHFGVKEFEIDGYNRLNFRDIYKRMLEFSALMSILPVIGKVITIKNETVVENHLLENNISEPVLANNISENNISLVICYYEITTIQRYYNI